ncbi:MAG TPA: hypothetical protein DEV81_00910, partial [Cyanobacteria bacterium UBA11049]|nr:hypothetical protein [Cyanobacteria bacterium UBA11049]
PANTTTKETDNSQKKVSNFIFAAFPNEIVSRLDELQFNHLKLTNLSPAVTSLQAKHEIEIKADVALDGISPQPSRSVFVKDGDGEYVKFGTLEPRTGKLPVGTKAQASVIPGQTYTAKATLTEPGKPPVEFTIREIAKFSHAGQIFNGERVTLTIANTQVPTDTALIKIDGKVLGELDSDSVNELKKVNCLENNKTLKLKLKSIGSTAEPGGFIIAESPKGNLLRLNKINYYDFKGQDFNDISHRNVTLELPPHKPKTAVFLDDKLLGVLHFNQDKSALKQLGILKNAGSNSFSCTLQSNFSHSSLIVDSATVQYPSTWVKEDVTNQNSQQLVVTEQEIAIQNSAPFLHKLKERATVLFSSHEDKMLGLAGLAVDNNKVAAVQQWLVSKGIEFDLVPKLEAPEESRKGLAVLYLRTNTIVPQDLQALKVKFGLPLDANGNNSPYSQHLKSLPNRPRKPDGSDPTKIDSPSSLTPVPLLETAANSNNAIASNSTTTTATSNGLAVEGSISDTTLERL